MGQNEAAAARQRLLQAGQAALLQRRAALQQERAGQDPAAGDHGRAAPSPPPAPAAVRTPTLLAQAAALPPGRSWGSERLTAALRRALANHEAQTAVAPADPRAWLQTLAARCPTAAGPPRPPAAPDTDAEAIILYPALALALLRHKLAAPARLWHLLRHLDRAGSGWVAAAAAQAAFTAIDAPLHFCGRRQLGNLLRRGEGLFWQQRAGRIWLRSPARLARSLGLARLGGRPVAVAAAELTGGIAAVRAHFYASFHSGRGGGPIARRTIAGQSGVAPRTQRSYDRRIGVGRRPNFARGPRLGGEQAETLAWQKGPACFTWTDHQGRKGAPGARYLAWQLPNSYDGPHAPQGRGRQKRVQRRLADLLHQGTTGNGRTGDRESLPRTYFASPRRAAQAANRAAVPVYWPDTGRRFWYCLC